MPSQHSFSQGVATGMTKNPPNPYISPPISFRRPPILHENTKTKNYTKYGDLEDQRKFDKNKIPNGSANRFEQGGSCEQAVVDAEEKSCVQNKSNEYTTGAPSCYGDQPRLVPENQNVDWTAAHALYAETDRARYGGALTKDAARRVDSKCLASASEAHNLWNKSYAEFDYWIFYRIEELKSRLEKMNRGARCC